MKLVWLSLLAVASSKLENNPESETDREFIEKYENSAGMVYPKDPRKVVFDWEEKETVDENIKWFDHVLENKKIENFIMEMANIRFAFTITASNAFEYVDKSPYCFAILTYDSEYIELAEGISIFIGAG